MTELFTHKSKPIHLKITRARSNSFHGPYAHQWNSELINWWDYYNNTDSTVIRIIVEDCPTGCNHQTQ